MVESGQDLWDKSCLIYETLWEWTISRAFFCFHVHLFCWGMRKYAINYLFSVTMRPHSMKQLCMVTELKRDDNWLINKKKERGRKLKKRLGSHRINHGILSTRWALYPMEWIELRRDPCIPWPLCQCVYSVCSILRNGLHTTSSGTVRLRFPRSQTNTYQL